jgi:uncharacterized protein DUF5330
MRFLLRVAFWLGLVFVLMPSGGSDSNSKSQVSAGEAMSAASAAVSDMSRFCDRQPDTCVVGSQAATTLGQRAQAGAKKLYEFLNEQFGPQETGTVASTNGAKAAPESAKTGPAVPLPPARRSQHTLNGTDLGPVWRGPQSHRERASQAN